MKTSFKVNSFDEQAFKLNITAEYNGHTAEATVAVNFICLLVREAYYDEPEKLVGNTFVETGAKHPAAKTDIKIEYYDFDTDSFGIRHKECGVRQMIDAGFIALLAHEFDEPDQFIGKEFTFIKYSKV